MSRYSTFLTIDDDEHEPECAKWARVPDDAPTRTWQMWCMDGRKYRRAKGNPSCTCGNPAPVVYQGSHVQPHESDHRGGWLGLAHMPDYCADPEGPVEFVRLSVGEDPRTYHHEDNQGQADLVLDRQQVTKLRDALTDWLDREDWA
jgi:hypothetical protein